MAGGKKVLQGVFGAACADRNLCTTGEAMLVSNNDVWTSVEFIADLQGFPGFVEIVDLTQVAG